MKTWTYLSVVILSIWGTSAVATEMNRSLCQAYVQSAEQDLEHAKERFNVGEVTTSGLALSQLNLLEAKFECRAISFEAYCVQAQQAWDTVVEGYEQEYGIGARTAEEVRKVRLESMKLESLCQ